MAPKSKINIKKSINIPDSEKNSESNSESNSEFNSDYSMILSNLPSNTDNIFGSSYLNDVNFSYNIDYPKYSLGYGYYIHQTKRGFEKELQQFVGKKEVFRTLNPFERYIDNSEESIGVLSKKYFDLVFKTKTKKPEILSRAFYKLWEILMLYDLIDLDNKKFVSAHLAEGPGSFIQATMYYRDMFSKYSKDDKYYAVTLHQEDEKNHVPALEKNFVDYYSKETPQRFILHKTYPKQVAGGDKKKDNGDLTNPKTIKLFGGDMKEKADLITADGGFEWTNENLQEQEAFRLIFGQIVAGILNQKKGGHFVIKFFETFTITSVKFMSILRQCYNKVDIVKPLTSRLSNSEKYLVCMDFKYDNNKEITTKLTEMLKIIHKEQKLKIVNVFSNFKPDEEFLNTITKYNIILENQNYKAINNIVKFIKAQNYYGDTYQMARQMQINAAKFWINNFLPSNIDKLDKIKKSLKKIFLI